MYTFIFYTNIHVYIRILHKTIKFCLILALIDAFFYQSMTGSYEDMRHLWFLLGLAVGVCENIHLTEAKNNLVFSS